MVLKKKKKKKKKINGLIKPIKISSNVCIAAHTLSGLELWVYNMLHMPAASCPSKQPTILIGEQAGGSQSWSWYSGELVLLLHYEFHLLNTDGIVINTKITAGVIVQRVSIICPSRMNRPVSLFWIILIIVYNTVMMIINIIIKV